MAQADRVHSTPPTNTPLDTTRRFETLKDAEDALMEQGFKLVPDTCNWIDADGIDAGVYPVEEAYGVSKYRIEYRSRHDRVHSTPPTNTSPLCPGAAIASPETGRFDADPPQRAPVVGARPTRRSVMNTPVALPIVDALPVAAPAMPLAIAE